MIADGPALLKACLADLSVVPILADWLAEQSDPREGRLRKYHRSWERRCLEAQELSDLAAAAQDSLWKSLAIDMQVLCATCNISFECSREADTEALHIRFRRYLRRIFPEWVQ